MDLRCACFEALRTRKISMLSRKACRSVLGRGISGGRRFCNRYERRGRFRMRVFLTSFASTRDRCFSNTPAGGCQAVLFTARMGMSRRLTVQEILDSIDDMYALMCNLFNDIVPSVSPTPSGAGVARIISSVNEDEHGVKAARLIQYNDLAM